MIVLAGFVSSSAWAEVKYFCATDVAPTVIEINLEGDVITSYRSGSLSEDYPRGRPMSG